MTTNKTTKTRNTITGEFSREQLALLSWPIAWDGTMDLESRAAEEGALRDLVDEARAELDSHPDSVAVVIEAGEIVTVLVGSVEEA